MKLNKKKLIALGLSALMCVSPLSSVAFAEELSDGSEEVVAVEEELGAEEIEAEIPAVEEVSPGYVLDKDSVRFHYNEDDEEGGLPDFSVTFERVNEAVGKRVADSLVSDGSEGDGVKWAKVLKITDANCEDPAYLWMQVTIDGVYCVSGDVLNKDEAFIIRNSQKLGHDYELKDTYSAINPANCLPSICELYVCKRCGKEDPRYTATQTTPQHKWGEWKTTYVAGTNTQLVDGNPELIDITKEGTYTVKVSRECTRCGEIESKEDKVETLPAVKAVKATITEQSTTIKDSLIGLEYMPDNNIPANDKIEMTDCTKDGWYIITFFDGNSKPIYEKKVDVAAHHLLTAPVVEFKSKLDAQQCEVKYDAAKGTYTIVNNSCYKVIDYYEVIHCKAAGCKLHACDFKKAKYYNEKGNLINSALDKAHLHEYSRTEKPVAPTGDHIIHADTKKLVEEYVKKCLDAKKVPEHSEIAALCKDTAKVKKHIVVTTTATCTEPGKTTVEYHCLVCDALVEKAEYDVQALGHDFGPKTASYKQAPTCEQGGIFDVTQTCKRCGYVKMVQENVKGPRLTHGNELEVHQDYKGNDVGTDDTKNTLKNPVEIFFYGDVVVDWNGSLAVGQKIQTGAAAITDGTAKGTFTKAGKSYLAFGSPAGINTATKDYVLYAFAGTKCKFCGKHIVALDADANGKLTELEITALTPSGKDGKAGSITVVGTYVDENGKTQKTAGHTVDYFTDVNAFQARVIDTTTPASEKIDPELTAKDIDVTLGASVEAGIVKDGYGTLTFESADESIATVDANGVVTGVAIGTTTIKVKLDGTAQYNAAETSFEVRVRPQGTVIYKLFDEGDGTLLVRWRAVEGVDGVQYAFATESDFSDAKYSVREDGVANQRRYGLENATYYVKARTYVVKDGKRVYSNWCTVKSIELGRYLPAPASMFCNVKSNGSVEFKVAPSAKAEGYQISYTNAAGTKLTSSSATAEFTRKLGTGSFKVAVRAFAYAEDGKYYSAWVDAGTVTIQ